MSSNAVVRPAAVEFGRSQSGQAEASISRDRGSRETLAWIAYIWSGSVALPPLA
jgi:hypothetical protein